MAYLSGALRIERVIRPGAVEELLCLHPEDGSKPIVFDLEASLKRTGLCEFIKECETAQVPLGLLSNGSLSIPAQLEKRFEYFKEYYGLTRWAVLGVDILQIPDKKEEKSAGGSGEGTGGMKKLEAEPPPPTPKPKLKTSKKIEAVPLRTVPAGIMWIADSPKGPGGPKGAKKTGPGSLSAKLGGHKVGVSSVGLGKPAAGLKSLGGMGGMRR